MNYYHGDTPRGVLIRPTLLESRDGPDPARQSPYPDATACRSSTGLPMTGLGWGVQPEG